MSNEKTSRNIQAADPDFEKILRELGQMGWKYHEWWQKYDDDISALIEVRSGKNSSQKIREYRKARSAVTVALADLAGIINEAAGN